MRGHAREKLNTPCWRQTGDGQGMGTERSLSALLEIQIDPLGFRIPGLLVQARYAPAASNRSKRLRVCYAPLNLLMNWFRAKGEISSGAVEGLNNKIRVVTRRSFGFRTYKAMEMALFHTLGRLPEPESAHKFC